VHRLRASRQNIELGRRNHIAPSASRRCVSNWSSDTARADHDHDMNQRTSQTTGYAARPLEKTFASWPPGSALVTDVTELRRRHENLRIDSHGPLNLRTCTVAAMPSRAAVLLGVLKIALSPSIPHRRIQARAIMGHPLCYRLRCYQDSSVLLGNPAITDHPMGACPKR
jgi:hypothetical protein